MLLRVHLHDERLLRHLEHLAHLERIAREAVEQAHQAHLRSHAETRSGIRAVAQLPQLSARAHGVALGHDERLQRLRGRGVELALSDPPTCSYSSPRTTPASSAADRYSPALREIGHRRREEQAGARRLLDGLRLLDRVPQRRDRAGLVAGLAQGQGVLDGGVFRGLGGLGSRGRRRVRLSCGAGTGAGAGAGAAAGVPAEGSASGAACCCWAFSAGSALFRRAHRARARRAKDDDQATPHHLCNMREPHRQMETFPRW
jgi:hypothetical protein